MFSKKLYPIQMHMCSLTTELKEKLNIVAYQSKAFLLTWGGSLNKTHRNLDCRRILRPTLAALPDGA